MKPRLGATKGQWVIYGNEVEGRRAIVVGYLDLGTRAWLPLTWFEQHVSDETIINWIIDVGRVRIGDEIATRDGSLFVWLPTGLKPRLIRLDDGSVVDLGKAVEA